MPAELKTVDAALLRPNRWNTNRVSPENEQKIEESIKRAKGLFKPVVVRQVKGEPGYEILGGEHRWRVALRMGYDQTPISNLGYIDDKLAKEIGLIDNGRYGEDDVIKLAALFKELGSEEELQSFLPMSEDDLASIFAASTIALDDLDAIDTPALEPGAGEGKPEATHQIMRFKVPVEDVAWIQTLFEKTIRTQGFTGEDSLTNAGNAFVHLINKVKEP